MKNLTTIKYLMILSILIVLVASCTEVVDVELETSKQRLVIDAAINWEKGTAGNEQTIVLTKTASYYEDEILYATGANVSITDENNTSYVFNETDPGHYETSLFVPQFDINYTLKITYNEQTYTSTEKFYHAPNIDLITQSSDQGFGPAPEVIMVFTDLPGSVDFYKTYMINNRNGESETFYFEDLYWEGNQGTIWLERRDFMVNDEIDCYVYGISERFQKYGEKLWNQSGRRNGPFNTPPINIKGNCVNSSQADDYPYGFFTMSEYNHQTYVFE